MCELIIIKLKSMVSLKPTFSILFAAKHNSPIQHIVSGHVRPALRRTVLISKALAIAMRSAFAFLSEKMITKETRNMGYGFKGGLTLCYAKAKFSFLSKPLFI